MDTSIPALAAILGAILLGAMSPGPSFVVVARTAVARSRRDGMAAAVAMGLGGVLFAVIALVGLYALLSTVDWLYVVLKIAGGAYLLYLAVLLWRHSGDPLDSPPGAQPAGRSQAFRTAFITQVSNPKAAVVYGSIFAALLPATVPVWWYVATPPLVFLVEAGWYSIVVLIFASRGPRALYTRAKKWIDRAAGAVIAVLGIRLIVSVATDR